MSGSFGSRIPGQQARCLLVDNETVVDIGGITARLMVKELEKLDKPEVAVKIFHMKPRYLEEIRADLLAHNISCRILDGKEQFSF